MTEHGHRYGSTDQADSAGFAWAGRSFDTNTFANDDGSAPEALAAAVAAFLAGETELTPVVDAIREARLLIPLLTETGEIGFTDEGKQVDKTQELAVVTVATPDGRTALPAFSSVAAMQAWNPNARPVPVDGVRVALAAAGEGTPVVVLDPGTPTQIALRRPAVWAIAKSEPWMPAHLDERVARILAESVEPEPSVRAALRHDGDPKATLLTAELEIELVLDPGLDADALNALLERLSGRWYADGTFAERVDRLGVKVVPAST